MYVVSTSGADITSRHIYWSLNNARSPSFSSLFLSLSLSQLSTFSWSLSTLTCNCLVVFPALTIRYVCQEFSHSYDPTIGECSVMHNVTRDVFLLTLLRNIIESTSSSVLDTWLPDRLNQQAHFMIIIKLAHANYLVCNPCPQTY